MRAEEAPHRVTIFLTEDDETERDITYGELFRAASSIAAALASRGISRGDTVALMLPTGFDFLSAFQGTLLLGAVAVFGLATLVFGLSTQDLDEGLIQWDHGQPYLIRHDADGFCTHQDRATGQCGCYQVRPAPCRSYDCRKDARIWTDFDQRVLAPEGTVREPLDAFRMEVARDRDVALMFESLSLRRQK